MSLLKQIREAVYADTVGKRRDGTFILRSGFFYRHGRTAETFAARVVTDLKAAGIEAHVVDKGEQWKAFKGGASIANSTHWWVIVSASRVLAATPEEMT